MSDIKWIKLTTDIFNDEKIRLIDAMPERDAIFVIWIRLLVLAGTTNHCGLIYLNEELPYTEEMLSTLFNRPLNVVRLALEILRHLKMIHILENQQIEIVNWTKHQYVEGMDKIREQWRERQEKHRVLLKEELDKNRLDKNKTHTVTSRDNKKEYVPSVHLTESEYDKLVDKYGEANTWKMINKLGNYKGAKGKKYASDYRAILSWVVDALEVKPGVPVYRKPAETPTDAEREEAEKAATNLVGQIRGKKT